MIRRIHIHNFKSIDALDFELGRVNVFIGENGCGKSNILEAIGMAAAAVNDKLDVPSLKARGIRVTDPRWMVCGFDELSDPPPPVFVCVHGTAADEPRDRRCPTALEHENSPYGEWRLRHPADLRKESNWLEHVRLISENVSAEMLKGMGLADVPLDNVSASRWFYSLFLRAGAQTINLTDYLCYSPREDALRDIEGDSDVEPIGIHGEGLFRLLQVLDSEGMLPELKRQLGLIHWFEDVSVVSGASPSTRALQLRDLYISGERAFDQRSANEGFLFVLLYASLLVSKYTPRFFAVDNVDTALNPKLCAGVAQMFARLTQQYDRQAILTTHNPGTLDGLDLNDDEQRLFVVYRNTDGMTRMRRILPASTTPGDTPVRLSEAFLRGYLGGLPTNF